MIPETLYNCNTFVDGRSYAGRATSMSPPKLKLKTDDFRAGGMDAAVKVDQGMEALEASFAMATMEYDVLKFFGLVDQGAFNGVFRSVFKDRSGNSKSVVVYLRGMLYEVDPGEWKPGDKVDAKFNVSCDYYKLEIDGAIVHEIDIFACKRVINGVDQLADVRKKLGMA
ncbi:phage tail protein [Burkholderia diffusa]|uniref:Phage major tail tube protein n=1 Tax=Burkholderia territorii TaxID=1503055 RepID=A0A6L3NRA0_9BURK|nr:MULTISPECIES: phage major tail tube protein [Burkholderia cepacia complex]KAB0686555.1 phage major tail tube protein [Burkholderia territorii]KVN46910.1 phage tail protein [Burkholderia territorii]KVT76129.1 phage tail protein [Burkholderia territorii]KWA11585.1 phage tail protein [Burkholderia territorii]KWF94034.1 phage tail protein [Burkholderia diffusa]